MPTPADDIASRELRISRVFDAPRELIWQAWTDPKHVGRWWGPNGFTTTTQEMQVQVGGVWRFTMHGPDGIDYPNKIVFTEIKEPSRLCYDHNDDDGKEGISFKVTIDLEDEGGKTRLTMRSLFPTAALLARVIKDFGALEGAHQHLARLDEYLRTMPN